MRDLNLNKGFSLGTSLLSRRDSKYHSPEAPVSAGPADIGAWEEVGFYSEGKKK